MGNAAADACYSPKRASVASDDFGNLSARLGEISAIPSNAFAGAEVFLGVSVNGDPEMTPRQTIDSVPYALVANNAIGDISPTTITVGGATIVDKNGKWVGSSAGLAGPAGPQGPAGAAGAPGATGPAGADGAIGLQGVAGPAGPAGSQGIAGIQGLPGVQGPPGPAGPQGPPSATSPIATGVLAFGNVSGGIGNGTIYNVTHPAAGSYVITFPGITLTTAPDPLIVTSNSCCSGTGPNVVVENYTSLSPLTWTVKTYNLAGTLENHDFSFVLFPGGS